MNTKYYSCSFQLQCNVVLIGKSNLVICQNLSGGKTFKLPFYLAPPIFEVDKEKSKLQQFKFF